MNIPAFVAGAAELTDPGVAIHLGTCQTCCFCVRMGDSRRVDMAFVRIVHGPDEVLLVEQGDELFRFSNREQFCFHA